MAPRVAKVVAEASTLPPDERAQVDELLCSLDEGDDLEDDDRARLHAALRQSYQEFKAGLGIPAAEILARHKRGGPNAR